ncbi:hypothetical protein DdX_11245 [Ditylenchus destructor]|uniref:Uncharacterized protein n=1 Tax=Ditylenchus destructor TaxID=166010 RepID=A0AAD4MYD9_9BILA|nr:hypothetical protein DdX_11245 [Ditylenchus destructor]
MPKKVRAARRSDVKRPIEVRNSVAMLVEKSGRRQPARSAQLRMNLSIRRLSVSLSIKSRSWKNEVCSIKLQISRSRKDPCRSKRESHGMSNLYKGLAAL